MSLEKFSKRLKCLMELEGISRRGLSVKANVQRKSLLNWLNGKFYPRYDALIRLADFFEVRTDYLLGLDDCGDKKKSGRSCPIEELSVQLREKLNCYLRENSISKYKLAKNLKVEQTTLERWFSAGAIPETSILIRLAAEMGETMDFLLGRE